MLDLYGKEALAWLKVNRNFTPEDGRANTRCYVFPKYLIEDNRYIEIDPTDFPQRGAIEVSILGGKTAFDIEREFGDNVIVRFNNDPELNQNPSADNKYFSLYNPKLPGTDIDFINISALHLRQIIDCNSTYDYLEKVRTIETKQRIATKEIMVKIEDKLYGPFNYDNKGENLIVSAFDPYNFYIGEYALEAFKPKVICLSDERNQFHTMYLIGYEKSSIFDQCLQKHDWVSDDKLIGEIISILKSNNATKFTRENRRVIKESIEQAAKTQKIGLLTDESRTNKLSSLLEYMETREELKESLVYEVLNKEEYIDKVIKFIVENRFELVSKKLHETDKVNKEIESQNQNLNEIKKQIELFKLEKKTTEEDIDRIKKEIAKGEIDNLKQIKMERKEEEKKKEDLILYNNLASDYITLEQQKVKLEEKNEIARQNYRHWDQEQRKLERELTDRIHNFTSSAALDIINKDFLGRVMKIVDGELTCKNCLHNILNEEKLLLEFSAHELIDHMTYYICEKSGRDYSRNDIVNLLICISQGFITTFAGEPGTGKTSLCNILSKALGLAGRLGDRRFVEVSVERGWSSYKDYIGYYNPLTKSFEKSNEEVFRAIETLDHEGENSRAPFFILLDEANLSPIEHYWANFIRLCDMDMDVNRTLNMGGEQTWKIPKTLRFLATVNFDHTTEELSPRFLDRAWVVMLEQCKIAEDLLMDYPVENHDQIFSFEKILEYLHQERMNN